MMVLYIFLILLTALVFTPVWAELMHLIGHLERNYLGKNIPQSMGAAFPIVYLAAAAAAHVLGLLPFVFLLRGFIITFGLGFIGLVDDIWGDQRVKGFSGHFRLLMEKGRISTGLLKAIFGFAVCLAAVHRLPGFFLLMLLRAVIVALSANLMNLLDLRPGRSLKGFFLLAFLLIVLVPNEQGILLLLPFLVTAFILFPRDLSGQLMLGDTGSNILGGMVGLVVVMFASAAVQVLYLAVLIGVHYLTERISLSKMIAGNPFLRFLDNLGRPGWQK